MGMSWPSQRAQPLGAKFPVKILISARNGFDINMSPGLYLFDFQITQLPNCLMAALTTIQPKPCKSRHLQFCDGKIPCSAMMKFNTRYGDMFSCGWLPPTTVIQAGFMTLPSADGEKSFAFVAHKFPPGAGWLTALVLPTGTCVWAGNS